MNPEARNIESTNNLTGVASKFSITPVISFANLRTRLDQQYVTDYEYLEKNYAEQDKLRAAVLRYQDLEREARVRRERAASIIVVLGEEKFKDREPSSKGDAKGIFFDTDNM